MATLLAFPDRGIAPVPPLRPAASPWRARLLTALILFAAAFAIRSVVLGDPMIEIDENFYLLVGDHMLHGALPYVDIWDRKPVGIFLLYAACRLLGGGGIVQYQVVATLFAAGTAFVIARMATRMATPVAGIAAGLLYLLMIGINGGLGGQSPVFYNLLVALAARITLAPVLDDGMDLPAVRRAALAAMLLMGFALQIKYSVVFEGVFLGLALLRELRRRGRAWAGLAEEAAAMVAVALLPTALAIASYAAMGHLDAFWYANFVSIFQRAGEPGKVLLGRLAHTWLVLHLPLFGVALSAALAPWRRWAGGPRAFRFTAAWLGAAVAGYLVFGSYFDHYALPLLVPIALGCAPLFSYRPARLGAVAAVLLLAAGGVGYALSVRDVHRRHGGMAALNRMEAAIRPRLTGCLYVFRGDPILYYETPSCLPSRWAFPSHLSLRREKGSIGVDQVAEIRRIFATRPSVVVDMSYVRQRDLDPQAVAVGRGLIARDYHLVAALERRRRVTLIYQRNDAVPPPDAAARQPSTAPGRLG